jgi:hypothetical protein
MIDKGSVVIHRGSIVLRAEDSVQEDNVSNSSQQGVQGWAQKKVFFYYFEDVLTLSINSAKGRRGEVATWRW